MKNRNDSPQPLKSKLNCRGMGCSFGSASSLQMVTSCSMTIKAQIQKNFDEYVLPYWRTRTVDLAWHCWKRYLHDPADLILVTTPISCPCEKKTATYAFGWLL
jgi:hypothetical protein